MAPGCFFFCCCSHSSYLHIDWWGHSKALTCVCITILTILLYFKRIWSVHIITLLVDWGTTTVSDIRESVIIHLRFDVIFDFLALKRAAMSSWISVFCFFLMQGKLEGPQQSINGGLWWSIGIAWCFSIDYGNVSRWIEEGWILLRLDWSHPLNEPSAFQYVAAVARSRKKRQIWSERSLLVMPSGVWSLCLMRLCRLVCFTEFGFVRHTASYICSDWPLVIHGFVSVPFRMIRCAVAL